MQPQLVKGYFEQIQKALNEQESAKYKLTNMLKTTNVCSKILDRDDVVSQREETIETRIFVFGRHPTTGPKRVANLFWKRLKCLLGMKNKSDPVPIENNARLAIGNKEEKHEVVALKRENSSAPETKKDYRLWSTFTAKKKKSESTGNDIGPSMTKSKTVQQVSSNVETATKENNVDANGINFPKIELTDAKRVIPKKFFNLKLIPARKTSSMGIDITSPAVVATS